MLDKEKIVERMQEIYSLPGDDHIQKLIQTRSKFHILFSDLIHKNLFDITLPEEIQK